MECALARKARIYCEVVGEGFSTDAYHLVKPEPHGDGATRAMKQAIDRAAAHRLIDTSAAKPLVVNAHATSTPIGDICEWNAIKSVVEAYDWVSAGHVTANKSSIGHCFAAAGAVETIFAIMSLQEVALGHTVYRAHDSELLRPRADRDRVGQAGPRLRGAPPPHTRAQKLLRVRRRERLAAAAEIFS